jgi:hypothetical protein
MTLVCQGGCQGINSINLLEYENVVERNGCCNNWKVWWKRVKCLFLKCHDNLKITNVNL